MASYVPQIGKLSKIPSVIQFEASRIDRLSFCTTPIEVTGDGCSAPASHATGFFWKRKNQTYLITNWHVVTGIDPLSKERTSSGLVPRWLEYYVAHFPPLDDKEGYFAPTRSKLKIELKPYGDHRWLQHPKFSEYAVDIVAIPIGQVGSLQTGTHVNEYGFEKLFHFVGDDAFVVGYPLGSYSGTMIPIWKRASLATEPLIQIDDQPMFLVDALTTQGMSGSPIFRRRFGPALLADMTMKADAAISTEFVGVYAGNLLHPELRRIGVGYAWYGKLVDEIVDGQSEGCSS